MRITFDTSELRQLQRDLGKVIARTPQAAADVVDDHGEQLHHGWVANAQQTSGRHGKHYPSSITAEQFGGGLHFGVEVGPQYGLLQGRMGRGFEYGSRNQPPHLDGNRAADVVAPKFHHALPEAVVDLLERTL